jgi:PAS domain S-box-containing protein
MTERFGDDAAARATPASERGIARRAKALARRVVARARRLLGVKDGSEAPHAALERLSDRMWELRESEARFQGLIDALGDLVVHRDREGRITYANRVLAELCGRPANSLTGLRLDELGIHVGVVPDTALGDGECLTAADVAIQTARGARWFSWTELSLRDAADGTVSHRALARDITARKRAETALVAARERAEHASRAKSRFLATVSHEIRTPMNGILGMAKLLADTPLSPEQSTYVEAVSLSAGSLMALIEDLLDFSKIEAGRFEPEPRPTSPRELVDGVVELLAARAHAKGIGLAAFAEPAVPHTILADPDRVRQVLLNLVGNAVKFTSRGGVLVSVTADEPARLRFAVADTGEGIAASERERIFEEFEQADNTTTRIHGGAGLGLSISRRIVRSMGGEIGVESGRDGSAFFFTLPISGHAAEMPGRPLAGRRILILSANAVEAEALRLTAQAYGAAAQVCADVEAAAKGSRDADTLIADGALEAAAGPLLPRLQEAGFRFGQAIVAVPPAGRDRLPALRRAGYGGFLVRPVRGATLLKALLSRLGPPAARRADAAPEESAAGGRSVLVAEDNEVNALLARAALARAGHRVELVGNGQAAVDLLTGPERRRFDLALMDLHMPVLDGLDAIGLIRRHEEATGALPLPVVVLSADGQEATRHAALAGGASGFVLKPLDPQELVAAVEAQAA